MQLLRRIAFEMQKAVVIVSHDHRTREIASRIAWLEDGTFRPDVATSRDPVCQCVVEILGYFCSTQCLEDFRRDPVSRVNVKE